MKRPGPIAMTSPCGKVTVTFELPEGEMQVKAKLWRDPNAKTIQNGDETIDIETGERKIMLGVMFMPQVVDYMKRVAEWRKWVESTKGKP